MKRTALVLLGACLLAACQPKLVIIHTNDTHSHLEPVRSGDNDGLGGAIERAAIIDSIRGRYGEDRVLLLHGGDFSQGTSYFTLLGGRVEDEVINAMGYDCITLGNHELDNGLEELAKRVKRIDCPIVCANIDFTGTGIDEKVKPYAVLERGGMKIGIIGLEADVASNVAAAVRKGIRMLDTVEQVNRWSEYLNETEKCDLVLLLSHQGYDEDQEIIAASRGLDLVVGGHSHTRIDRIRFFRDLDGRRVGLVQDWCWGMELGKVVLR